MSLPVATASPPGHCAAPARQPHSRADKPQVDTRGRMWRTARDGLWCCASQVESPSCWEVSIQESNSGLSGGRAGTGRTPARTTAQVTALDAPDWTSGKRLLSGRPHFGLSGGLATTASFHSARSVNDTGSCEQSNRRASSLAGQRRRALRGVGSPICRGAYAGVTRERPGRNTTEWTLGGLGAGQRTVAH